MRLPFFVISPGTLQTLSPMLLPLHAGHFITSLSGNEQHFEDSAVNSFHLVECLP
jgi:hypothetical protein